jgi:hypothetical protein
MPILGIIASGISGNLAPLSSYASIATFTLGSAQSSVTFSSIPSTYTHLQLRILSQRTDANGDGLLIQFNSDTGNNYGSHYFNGNGASVGAGTLNTGVWATGCYTGFSSGTSASAFAGTVCDILDYTNTSKYTSTRALSGWSNISNSEGVGISSGLWRSTSAVTSIKIIDPSTNLNTNSSYALYGIKGS